MEAALAILEESGLGPKERHHAFLAIIGHVRGHATFQQIGRRAGSRKEWGRELTQMLQSEAHRYPILLDIIRSGGLSENVAGAFEFGLNLSWTGFAHVSAGAADVLRSAASRCNQPQLVVRDSME
jgi:hypothetical protein